MPPMVFVCCVPNCSRTTKNTSIHRFPKDEEVYKKWLSVIQRSDLIRAVPTLLLPATAPTADTENMAVDDIENPTLNTDKLTMQIDAPDVKSVTGPSQTSSPLREMNVTPQRCDSLTLGTRRGKL
ncbi:hypothetical protein RN001_008379 [Aquatica leii]|uniref:THAP-type domain-containing protein n=1 Tax=Aquatica leii TaxID=1421715 RepID=A0AAN7QIZ2_9COLE|nr:hypothetical protein RN001_008379 [Aquatica leii]